MTNDKHDQTALRPWMRPLLVFAGCFNVLAGFCMVLFYHEGYKLLGIPKPEIVLPVQVMGILVALFGVGYLLVARSPVENRHILALGFWSKALSSVLAISYIINGELPLIFLPIVIFSDVIYLPLFYLILRVIYRQAAQTRHN